MEWQSPEALYLILPLCVGWFVLSLDSQRRRNAARQAFAANTMWSRIFPTESRSRFLLKLFLREIGLALCLVALAGPRFGIEYEQVVPRGSDLYVLIDVSRSMLADDVLPSRLGRAKADVASLVNRLDGERVGLIAFAGQAVVKCPLTIDYDSFRRSLEELDPDSAPRGGTAIGDAIRKALEVFQAKSERDQAILLITDGDDQQSYPLEAAEVAAERRVTIFAIGLGDADHGARVPQKSDTKAYVEYQGEQVWSKLDSNLLQQIALKTSGVYVPAGTRSYDLSELYTNHLQGRRGQESTAEKKIRRSERFQIFLAIGLICLIIDLCVAPYRRSASGDIEGPFKTDLSGGQGSPRNPSTANSLARITAFLTLSLIGSVAESTEPVASVRDGLKLYSKDQFDEAKEKFSAANDEFEKRKLSVPAAIAAFDEACALHRKGDLEHARDSYLRAGLCQDPKIATAAHFNLGNLSAEKARELCGNKPEAVPADKRTEILDQLSHAITSYRHCLEIQPDHGPARRNLELIRQWIKHYTDKWHESDRQKRRDESNLLEFLEYLIQTQTGLKKTVEQLPDNTPSDTFAEIKRAQDELREEIPTLRDKIAEALRPQDQSSAAASPADNKEADEGIALLREWADKAGRKMASASHHLKERSRDPAAEDQQAASDELENIWDAVVPFQPLLNKLLNDQTSISHRLNPKAADSNDTKNPKDAQESASESDSESEPNSPHSNNRPSQQLLMQDEDDVEQLEKEQTKTLQRTRMLGPKAEMEMKRLEEQQEQQAQQAKQHDPAEPSQDDAVDPEEVKKGLQTAIDRSPQAVEEMDATTKSLRQKDRTDAGAHAEQARKVLEEIQKAQPKSKQKQNQKQQQNQDQQQNKDQGQNQDEKDDSQKQQDQQNQDQQSKPDQKPQDQKSQGQVSRDQIEEALRKVRERQQEKRERDRKQRASSHGKTSVDKDW